MGRTPRVQPAGGTFHLTSRGNRRDLIFRDGFDYHSLGATLMRVVVRFRWQCLSYCFMPNHYHLVIRTPDQTLAQGMQVLNLTHAVRFNWRHGYEGHLFERPYRSKLIENEAHLLGSIRYDVLNPVRGGLCEQPEDWPWSSHRATAGIVPAPGFLDLGRVFELFRAFSDDARGAYRSFVEKPWLD